MATYQDVKDAIDTLRGGGLTVNLSYEDFSTGERYKVRIKNPNGPDINNSYNSPEEALEFLNVMIAEGE